MEKVLYRYHEIQSAEFWSSDPKEAAEAMRLFLDSFPVIKDTPCGCWIDRGYGIKKFVNLKAVRKWAHETPEDAMKSFIARKNRQIRILKNQLLRAEAALHLKDVKPTLMRKGTLKLYCEV